MKWRRAWPWVMVFLAPLLLFPDAWLSDGVVSADDHLSVHPAFQETAGGDVRHPHLSDPALQFAALRARVVQDLNEGEIPLWNPDIYGGAPLLANGQSMVGSPVIWFRLFFAEDLAQDVGVAWILIWTAMGMAVLLRRLNVPPWPAIVGAMAAMTGPYVHVWLLHPQAATYCWIPWVLWAIERRSLASVALCVCGLLWGGHPGTALHGMVLAMGWWAVRSRCRNSAIGMVLGLLLSMPLTLPLIEQALRSTTAAARGGSVIFPVQLLDMVWPGWLGHPATETWEGPGSWADGQLHPGLGALVLASLALGGPRRRLGRGCWCAWAILCLGSLVVLPGPFNHARLGSLGALFLAMAAGLGVARLRSLGTPAMLGMALVVLFSGAWARQHDQGVLAIEIHAPEPAAWTQDLAAELDCLEGGDCGKVLGLGWWLQPNTGSLVGLRDLRGYDLPVSEETQRLMASLSSPPRGPWYPVDTLPSIHLLRFAGVRAIVSDSIPASSEDWVEIPLTNSPVMAWKVPGDIPRAWLSRSAEGFEQPDLALQAIRSVDRRGSPPVEGLTMDLDADGPIEPVSVVEESSSIRTVSIESDSDSLFVLSEAWAPGWVAELDGQDVPVLRVGGAFIGVEVPAGPHELTLRYRPKGWVIGSALGGLGSVMLFLWVFIQRRKNHNVQAEPSVSPSWSPASNDLY